MTDDADMLINQIDHFYRDRPVEAKVLPYAVEACWMTENWSKLKAYLRMTSEPLGSYFDVGVAQAMGLLYDHQPDAFRGTIQDLRTTVAHSLSYASTASLQTCHEDLLKFHVLTEMELLAQSRPPSEVPTLVKTLDRRLDVLGAYPADKQYLLGIRRATMALLRYATAADAWTLMTLTVSC